MAYVRAALLAWQFRKPLVIGCLALLLLPLLLFTALVAAIFAVPLASDEHLQMYAKAARELKDTKGLDLGYRWPLAVDAVRHNQDFTGVTLDTARQTVDLFVETITVPGQTCEPEEAGCTCTQGPKPICRFPDTQRYTLRTLGQVLDALGFTAEQQEMALAMAVVDLGNTSCYGFRPTEGLYVWPVPGEITSCFGYRTDPFHAGHAMHWGVDVAAPSGTPILAAHAGRVSLASLSGDYGNLIVLVADSEDLHTWYGHLDSYAVTTGQQVERGQVIGYVGNTGRSTAAHLHYEMRRDSGSRPVDPITFY